MMVHRTHRFASGLTLVEMMISMAILLIVVAGVGTAVADGFHQWQRMYDRLYSNLAADSVAAPRVLDRVVRKAAGARLLIGAGGDFVEVCHFADQSSTFVDRYARLYFEGGRLKLEQGELTPRRLVSSRTICENVSDGTFRQFNRSVQMELTLDDGDHRRTIVSSAFIHSN